jgi:Vault protein inter-alpha-trypsin domain
MTELIALSEEHVTVPLKKIDVDVKINNNIANVTIVQLFENTMDKNIEALYKFPIPASSTVYDFQATVGDHKNKTRREIRS